jgi:UDP-2,3-diacylglucosamine hydrolase
MKTSLFLEDKEWLILYSKKTGNQTLQLRFGHRHLPMKVSVGKKFWICKSRRLDYVFHLWRFDGENFEIKNTRIYWDKYSK